jgi:hypothetical protein
MEAIMSRVSLRWAGAAIALATVSSATVAAHPAGDVQLKSATGAVITAGSNVPYSPKKTCGTCHSYESAAMTVQKQQTVQGVVGTPYDVSVPQHGVSSGYHFQQGFNVAWGDTQKSYYGVLGLTSSPGMFGKL